MKIRIGFLFVLLLSFLLSFLLLKKSHAQCKSTKKLYFAIVEDFPTREAPHFRRAIDPKHLRFFRMYYKVFLCDKHLTKFEIYKNQKRTAIISRNPDYIEYKRLNEIEDIVFLQHLYYDHQRRLIRQENYQKFQSENELELFTFYTYFYRDRENYPLYIQIFDSKGNPIQEIDTSIWGWEAIPLRRRK